MKDKNIILGQALILLIAFTGCSSPKSNYSYSPAQREREVDKLIEGQQKYRDGVEAEKAALRKKIEQLQAENDELKRVNQQGDVKKLAAHLEINDKILEHKDEIIKGLQADWEKKSDSIYAALKGGGTLKEFQVEDVCFYNGAVAVTMLFLASNQDGTGGLMRGCINLDPDKDFEVAGSGVVGEMLISAQEYAALSQGNGSGVEQKATQIERHPENAGQSQMSEATKNQLIGGGIAAGLIILQKLLSNDN